MNNPNDKNEKHDQENNHNDKNRGRAVDRLFRQLRAARFHDASRARENL